MIIKHLGLWHEIVYMTTSIAEGLHQKPPLKPCEFQYPTLSCTALPRTVPMERRMKNPLSRKTLPIKQEGFVSVG
ncbi:MAG: hypothetical protein NW226_20130 [Microscillaceae bacterium]|nr:hypothetical protein [Microscillaceae bacterium]